MKTLQCRRWTTVLVLTLSGCAGELDNAQDYGTRTPVSESSVSRTPEAGRGTVAGAGGSKTPQAGRASESTSKPAMNMNASMNMSSNMPRDGGGEDAGVGEDKPMQTAMPAASAACDFGALMQAKCGNPSCHGAPASGTGLDLTTAMLAMRADGRKGKGTCTDKLLVDTDNPRESKLYLKVSGNSCGSQMPLGGMLTQDEQTCVLNWIEKL
jgi:hypothetical protein